MGMQTSSVTIIAVAILVSVIASSAISYILITGVSSELATLSADVDDFVSAVGTFLPMEKLEYAKKIKAEGLAVSWADSGWGGITSNYINKYAKEYFKSEFGLEVDVTFQMAWWSIAYPKLEVAYAAQTTPPFDVMWTSYNGAQILYEKTDWPATEADPGWIQVVYKDETEDIMPNWDAVKTGQLRDWTFGPLEEAGYIRISGFADGANWKWNTKHVPVEVAKATASYVDMNDPAFKAYFEGSPGRYANSAFTFAGRGRWINELMLELGLTPYDLNQMEDYRTAVQWYKDNIHDYYQPLYHVGSEDMRTLWETEEVWGMWGWNSHAIQHTARADTGLFTQVAWPEPFYCGNNGYVIPKNVEHPWTAAALINFLISQPALTLAYDPTKVVGATTGASAWGATKEEMGLWSAHSYPSYYANWPDFAKEYYTGGTTDATELARQDSLLFLDYDTTKWWEDNFDTVKVMWEEIVLGL
jgi:hypothetical protein